MAKFRYLGDIMYLALGAFLSEKYRSNDLDAIFIKKSPKIHLNKLKIWATFYLNFDQKFLWAKVLTY
jgi:hypothetical protein